MTSGQKKRRGDKCLKCGSKVGYDPQTREMVRLQPDGEMKLCDNGIKHGVCNWLLPAEANDILCVACRMNRTIPDLHTGRNLMLWGRMEMAKRRLIYTLLLAFRGIREPLPGTA